MTPDGRPDLPFVMADFATALDRLTPDSSGPLDQNSSSTAGCHSAAVSVIISYLWQMGGFSPFIAQGITDRLLTKF